MTEEKDKCDTCEHRGDSSNEYCGSCGGGVESNWKEAGWSKDKTINELRTRVAEEERMKDAAVVQADTFKTAWEELKKRVADLEKELQQEYLKEDIHKRTFCGRPVAYWFDLLKASEGMEKALNEIADMAFFWERFNKQDGGSRKGTKYEELAKQALADFRALKGTR